MSRAELHHLRVGDLVRGDPRLMPVLADLGITPRYLFWTLEDAARDLGVSLDRIDARILGAAAA